MYIHQLITASDHSITTHPLTTRLKIIPRQNKPIATLLKTQQLPNARPRNNPNHRSQNPHPNPTLRIRQPHHPSPEWNPLNALHIPPHSLLIPHKPPPRPPKTGPLRSRRRERTRQRWRVRFPSPSRGWDSTQRLPPARRGFDARLGDGSAPFERRKSPWKRACLLERERRLGGRGRRRRGMRRGLFGRMLTQRGLRCFALFPRPLAGLVRRWSSPCSRRIRWDSRGSWVRC